MRVSKNQIIRGVSDYIKEEILPKMGGAMQIIASIAVNAAAMNEKTLDSLFRNEMVLSLLDDDGSGTYDVTRLSDAIQTSIGEYGSLPVRIPPIPFVSPQEITLTLNANDIDAMRRKIEMA